VKRQIDSLYDMKRVKGKPLRTGNTNKEFPIGLAAALDFVGVTSTYSLLWSQVPSFGLVFNLMELGV
jgi:hypothetical protein